jgi:hypothetical protein
VLGRHSSGHRLSVILNQGTLKEGMALPGTRGIGRKSVLSEKCPKTSYLKNTKLGVAQGQVIEKSPS